MMSDDLHSTSGPPSVSMSEEGKSSSQKSSSKKDGDTQGEDSDLIKFKSQIGIINKMKVSILIAQNLKEDQILDIN